MAKQKNNRTSDISLTTVWVVLISCLLVAGGWRESLAQQRKPVPPAINGFPPWVLLASDIPLPPTDPCCGRFSNRNQLLVRNSTLFWVDSSDTPIKRMSTNGGEITALARWTGSPINAVTRGQYIYWIEDGAGPTMGRHFPRLQRTSLDGMETTTLDEGQRYSIYPGTADIIVTDSDAYWVNTVDATTCNGIPCWTGLLKWLIRRVPLNGDPPTTLVTTSTSSNIISMATDGTDLYWEEDADYMASASVKKIPLHGGQVTDVVNGTLNGIAADWQPVGGIALGGTELFFASYGQGIMKVPVSGGTVTLLTGDFPQYETAPRKLAVDDAQLYWFDMASLQSMPRNGGTITALATGLGLPMDLAIRNGLAIWAEAYCCGRMFTGSIKSVSTIGGPIVTLVSGLDGVRSLDVGSDSLYFIEGEGGTLPQSASGRIAKAAIGGGAVSTIVSAVMAEVATPMAVDDTSVYFADATGLKKVSIQGGVVETLATQLATGTVSALATDGEFVYWLSRRRSPIVRKIPVGGGPIEDLMSVGSSQRYASSRLVLENGYLYWVEYASSIPPAGAIMKLSVLGGPAITLVSDLSIGDVAVAGADLYFTEAGYPDTVRKISIDGGQISTLAAISDGSSLAADNGSVYWVNFFQLGTASGGTQRWLAAGPEGFAIAVDQDGIYWMEYPGEIVKIDRSTIDHFVNIFAPLTGDVWPIRSQGIIQWWYGGISNKVTISLSRDGGNSWTTLFRNKPNKGSQSWKVTKPATTQAIFRVCSVGTPAICDTSDVFTIK